MTKQSYLLCASINVEFVHDVLLMSQCGAKRWAILRAAYHGTELLLVYIAMYDASLELRNEALEGRTYEKFRLQGCQCDASIDVLLLR